MIFSQKILKKEKKMSIKVKFSTDQEFYYEGVGTLMGEYFIEVLGAKISGEFALFAGDEGVFYVSVHSDFDERVLNTNECLEIDHSLFIKDSYSGGTKIDIPCKYYLKPLEKFVNKFNECTEDVEERVIKRLEIKDGRLHYT